MEPRGEELRRRLAAARRDVEESLTRMAESMARIRATRELFADGRPARELMHDSVNARLIARLETLPVIEQAKGVLMARGARSADDAFDMLRRASQRTNVPVRELAAEIVHKATGEPPPVARRDVQVRTPPARTTSGPSPSPPRPSSG